MKKEKSKKRGHSRVFLSGISLFGVVYQIRKQFSYLTKTEKVGVPRTLRAATSGMTTLLDNNTKINLGGSVMKKENKYPSPWMEAAARRAGRGERGVNSLLSPLIRALPTFSLRGRRNKAFTLIELLVVVLIIGILAAIALPQYQKAVIRTRYATLKNLTRSIADAEEVFYLVNNTYSVDFEELDVQMPGGKLNTSTTNYYHYDWGSCGLTHTEDSSNVQCNNNLVNMSFQIRFKHSKSSPGKYLCVARGSTSDTTPQAEVCKAETGRTNPSNTDKDNKYTSWWYKNWAERKGAGGNLLPVQIDFSNQKRFSSRRERGKYTVRSGAVAPRYSTE